MVQESGPVQPAGSSFGRAACVRPAAGSPDEGPAVACSSGAGSPRHLPCLNLPSLCTAPVNAAFLQQGTVLPPSRSVYQAEHAAAPYSDVLTLRKMAALSSETCTCQCRQLMWHLSTLRSLHPHRRLLLCPRGRWSRGSGRCRAACGSGTSTRGWCTSETKRACAGWCRCVKTRAKKDVTPQYKLGSGARLPTSRCAKLTSVGLRQRPGAWTQAADQG